MIEDRKGSIWIGNNHGIRRFRETKVLPISHREGRSSDTATAIAAAPDVRRTGLEPSGPLLAGASGASRTIRQPFPHSER